MSILKKPLAALLCLFLLMGACCFPSYAEEAAPTLSAKSAVLIEAESGTVVFAHNETLPLPMASTTKIMTALVALEMSAPDTEITVDARAIGVEGSSIYLTEGEILTLEQLLYALLLESANDAAVAIAVGLAGSVEAFAKKMNEKARALGLMDTHFVNPHGLDDERHYTTAHELAKIAQAVLANDLLRTIVSTRKTTIPHAGTDGVRLLVNHNKLLRLYNGCIGVKTGFTKKSGRCLVSAAARDGVTLIAVTLDSPDDWNDHMSLFDYGFSRFTSVLLCDEGAITHTMPITGGVCNEVTLCNADPLRMTLPAGHGEITHTIEAARFSYAPIAAGEILGKVVFYCDTDGDGIKECLGEVSLVSCNAFERKTTKKGFWKWLCGILGIKSS